MKQSSHGLATSGMKTLAWSTSPPFPAGGSTNGPYRTVVTCIPPVTGSAPAGVLATISPGTNSATPASPIPSTYPSRLIMYGTVPQPAAGGQDPTNQSNSASGRISPYSMTMLPGTSSRNSAKPSLASPVTALQASA